MASQRNQVQGKMDKFFSKFDQDQTEGSGGGWDDEALKKALIAAYPEKSDQVDQAAIDFVKSVADVSKNNVIDRDEVVAAIQAYTTYIDRKDEIDRVLARYDKDNDGQLDSTEVKSLLEALTEGNFEVTDNDVDLVMQMCDASRNEHIDPAEIKKALAFWYGQLADREAGKSSPSKMCIIL